jgi:hypothetical protein
LTAPQFQSGAIYVNGIIGHRCVVEPALVTYYRS